MDIETVADLTNESQAKLAKAKSRGLTCTLVMEASISEKHGMKSRISSKCNANIHTYTSCFMDIQQWEKESLEAYIHQFKN